MSGNRMGVEINYWLNVYQQAQSYLKGAKELQPKLEGDVLSCLGKEIHLVSRKSTLDLLRLFFIQPNHSMCKQDIIEALYGNIDHYSFQLRSSLQHNLVKRISRARLLLSETFGTDLLDWLYYEETSQTWSLYRLKI